MRWTARADLAEADASVLAGAGQLVGITPLTALKAFTLADFAATASELTGDRSGGWLRQKTNGVMPRWRAACPIDQAERSRSRASAELRVTDQSWVVVVGDGQRPPASPITRCALL